MGVLSSQFSNLLVQVAEFPGLVSRLNFECSKLSSLHLDGLLALFNFNEYLSDLSLDVFDFTSELVRHLLEVLAGFFVVQDQIVAVSILVHIPQ